jgi:hypothetical protein
MSLRERRRAANIEQHEVPPLVGERFVDIPTIGLERQE